MAISLSKLDWTLINDPGVGRVATPLNGSGAYSLGVPLDLIGSEPYSMYLQGENVLSLLAGPSQHSAEIFLQPVFAGTGQEFVFHAATRAEQVNQTTGEPLNALYVRLSWDQSSNERKLYLLRKVGAEVVFLNPQGSGGELIPPAVALDDVLKFKLYVRDVGASDVQVQVDVDDVTLLNVRDAQSYFYGKKGTWGLAANQTSNAGDRLLMDAFIGGIDSPTEAAPAGEWAFIANMNPLIAGTGVDASVTSEGVVTLQAAKIGPSGGSPLFAGIAPYAPDAFQNGPPAYPATTADAVFASSGEDFEFIFDASIANLTAFYDNASSQSGSATNHRVMFAVWVGSQAPGDPALAHFHFGAMAFANIEASAVSLTVGGSGELIDTLALTPQNQTVRLRLLRSNGATSTDMWDGQTWVALKATAIHPLPLADQFLMFHAAPFCDDIETEYVVSADRPVVTFTPVSLSTSPSTTLPPSNAPTDLLAEVSVNFGVDLTWTDTNAGGAATIIERSTDGGVTWTYVTFVEAGTTTFNDVDAGSPGTYHYQVKASNLAGTSAASNVDDVTVS
jgi:hypothetical protein